MPKHVMVVLSNTKPELEDEFNDWYSNAHIVEVINRLDGFASAQRFSFVPDQLEDGEYKYLAIYEIEDDKLEAAQKAQAAQRRERKEALAAGREPFIESRAGELFDGEHRSWFFTAVDEPYRKGDRPDPRGDAGLT